MIRRVFWLSVGAAAGITGYRRATAMGRAITVRLTGEPAQLGTAAGYGPADRRPGRARPRASTVWRAQRTALRRIRAAGLFARDVREGMDIYLNRQEGQAGPTLADTTRNRRPPARPQ